MKIYFAASVKGKANYVKEYEKIVEVLLSMGHQVYSDHILKNDSEKLENQSKEEVEKAYRILTDNMRKSDLVVAEVSTPSVSVGHEISEALATSKPVIMMHVKGGNRAMLLEGRRDEKIQYFSYTLKDLEEKLAAAVLEAAKMADVRFNFFVSPKILAYMDWIAKKRMVPRSVFLRDLIEKEMRKDREYKN